MADPSEIARLSDDERKECERCAREGGWPDDFYFGLLDLVLRAQLKGEV